MYMYVTSIRINVSELSHGLFRLDWMKKIVLIWIVFWGRVSWVQKLQKISENAKTESPTAGLCLPD
jgi:hypothetical protein